MFVKSNDLLSVF